MNSHIHDELQVVRHVLATLRSELQYVRTALNDMTYEEQRKSQLPVVHHNLMSAGLSAKAYEEKLVAQL